MTDLNSVNITPAQLEELRKADPAAFDLETTDETLPAEGKTQEQPVSGNPEGGEEAVTETAGEGASDDAGTTERKPHMIPKARFDEAIDKERQRNDALAARLEELEKQVKASPELPTAPLDFAAEKSKLRKQYDDGDIDSEEYENKRDELILQQARYEVQAEQAKRASEQSAAAVKQEWDTMIGTWAEANKDFLDNPIRNEAVERLLERYGADPSLSNAELLEKVQKDAFEAFNWNGSVATAPAPGASARDVRDASAAAAASALPGAFAGGAGNRGTEVLPNIETIKPGQFNKLSKADQAKLLGGEAAL